MKLAAFRKAVICLETQDLLACLAASAEFRIARGSPRGDEVGHLGMAERDEGYVFGQQKRARTMTCAQLRFRRPQTVYVARRSLSG